jgi:hypothetical protein
MKRNRKQDKKIALHHETLRTLSAPALRGAGGGKEPVVGSGTWEGCLLSDYAAIFGVSTTGIICPA